MLALKTVPREPIEKETVMVQVRATKLFFFSPRSYNPGEVASVPEDRAMILFAQGQAVYADGRRTPTAEDVRIEREKRAGKYDPEAPANIAAEVRRLREDTELLLRHREDSEYLAAAKASAPAAPRPKK